MKYFIITIDTEGDNLWNWCQGKAITTENSKYLQRFQNLCNEYGFKPVWLTDYEMMEDSIYIDFITKVEDTKNGEIGMHLHAWSTPPEHQLKMEKREAPYITEYPLEIIREKIATMTEKIKNRTGTTPISHRAGRWKTNQTYLELLKKYGYKIDCSVTPHVDWRSHPGLTKDSFGSNYLTSPQKAYWIDEEETFLEVPLTIRKSHKFFKPEQLKLKRVAGQIKRMIIGDAIWLRPGHSSEEQMYYLIDQILDSDDDYLMLMLHSSEFMPGGSPTFKTIDSVEELYQELRRLFSYIANNFKGITLRDYYGVKKK